jgi:predicted CoA-binding protein
VIPVNRAEKEILGEKSYPSLKDIPEPVDIVDVFAPGRGSRGSRRTQSRSARRRYGLSSTVISRRARESRKRAASP